jgi:hypothetical protein
VAEDTMPAGPHSHAHRHTLRDTRTHTCRMRITRTGTDSGHPWWPSVRLALSRLALVKQSVEKGISEGLTVRAWLIGLFETNSHLGLSPWSGAVLGRLASCACGEDRLIPHGQSIPHCESICSRVCTAVECKGGGLIRLPSAHLIASLESSVHQVPAIKAKKWPQSPVDIEKTTRTLAASQRLSKPI